MSSTFKNIFLFIGSIRLKSFCNRYIIIKNIALKVSVLIYKCKNYFKNKYIFFYFYSSPLPCLLNSFCIRLSHSIKIKLFYYYKYFLLLSL
jgi:hypothetical protein